VTASEDDSDIVDVIRQDAPTKARRGRCIQGSLLDDRRLLPRPELDLEAHRRAGAAASAGQPPLDVADERVLAEPAEEGGGIERRAIGATIAEGSQNMPFAEIARRVSMCCSAA
jgi:hypothetical protein